MTYITSKTYGHDLGLSVCFRQHGADSHCAYLHGYALSIRIQFEATELDYRNWVVDFGDLRELKSLIRYTFDHKLLVSEHDPKIDEIKELGRIGLAQVVVVRATGCEAFAKLVYGYADTWLVNKKQKPRVRVAAVTVSEHGANSATYLGEEDG